MPFVSKKQDRWAFSTKQPFAKKWAGMTNQKSLPMKKKLKLKVNNKMRGALGAAGFNKNNKPTGLVEINVKKHKGDKAELASTIKHEMLHVKNPKMTEKDVYAKSRKTHISPEEQSKLISKLRMKSLNYKGGAIKRRFKMGNGSTKPGDMISRMNESKTSNIKKNNSQISKTKLSIMGLV